ncbi:MAG: caspase family protein [Acidimicrobiales bacterium]
MSWADVPTPVPVTDPSPVPEGVGSAAPAVAPGDVPFGVAPDHFDAPAAPTRPLPPLSWAPPPGPRASSGTWAVVIGIDHYPGGGNDLQSAVNDADAVDSALAQYGVPADHLLTLQDGTATAANIERATDWLVARSGPESAAMFVYSGHVLKLSSDTEALVGSDGRLVTDTDLARHLSGLTARRTWIMIDGCYGGGFTEALAPGRILTAAAPADDLAYENESLGHSYLVEYMVVQGLIDRRAPGTTLDAAFAWAHDAIARDYPGREPVQIDDGAGDLDLATLNLPPAPSPEPVAPAPASNPAPARGGSGSGPGGPPPQAPDGGTGAPGQPGGGCGQQAASCEVSSTATRQTRIGPVRI